MHQLAPFIAPALALYFILRRGGRERRVKPGRLWIYPLVIALLAVLALSRGQVPTLEAYIYFMIAIAAGGALGWFTTQHVELTLDPQTGTIVSKPTRFGTTLTAAVFVLRFAIEFAVNGGPNGGPPAAPRLAPHAGTLLWFADAGLLFVAARVLAQAAHMWLRIRPLLAEHEKLSLPIVMGSVSAGVTEGTAKRWRGRPNAPTPRENHMANNPTWVERLNAVNQDRLPGMVGMVVTHAEPGLMRARMRPRTRSSPRSAFSSRPRS
ncbi:MAG: hypothetical protein WDN08_16255 [Rhizomicrobium sp.]